MAAAAAAAAAAGGRAGGWGRGGAVRAGCRADGCVDRHGDLGHPRRCRGTPVLVPHVDDDNGHMLVPVFDALLDYPLLSSDLAHFLRAERHIKCSRGRSAHMQDQEDRDCKLHAGVH